MKLIPQTFLTADTHLFHTNLWKLWGRPEDSDNRIISNWNYVVGKNDNILHLGDVIFSNKEKAIEVFNKLNGNKYLIRENHDGQSETWFADCGFTTIEPIFKRYKDKYGRWINVLFTHEPVLRLPKGWFNIHGHMHGDKHRGTLLENEKYFDVGVDSCNFQPIKLSEILVGFWEQCIWEYEEEL